MEKYVCTWAHGVLGGIDLFGMLTLVDSLAN